MDDEDVGHALLKDGDRVKCLSFREFHAAEDEFIRIQREGPFVAFGAGDDDFGAFELLACREGGLGFGRNRRKSFFDRRFKGSGAFRDEGERAVQQEGEVAELGGWQGAVVVFLILPEPREEIAAERAAVFVRMDVRRDGEGWDGGGIELEEFGRGEIGRQRDGLESEGLGEEAEEEVELMLRCRRRVKQVFRIVYGEIDAGELAAGGVA